MIMFQSMDNKLKRVCENIIEACWLAAVILTPLFFNIYSSRIFEPDKISLLRSLAVIIVAAWITLFLINIKKIDFPNLISYKTWIINIRSPFVLPVGLMIVGYILATVFSVNPQISWFGSYQRSQGTFTVISYLVFFVALVLHLRSKVQLDRLLNIILLTSLPVAMYGGLQHFHLDPIPWGKDTSIRVASSLGNSIFVAAYLIMVFPISLGRFLLTAREIISGITVKLNWLRLVFYGFTCLLHISTIYFSGSRGPVLGWLAGILFLLYILSFQWNLYKFNLYLLALTIIGAGFLIVFNTAGGPFETLRNSPVLGRFGRILDSESNTAKVRTYIWEGAVDLVLPHAPIEYPDGKKDPYNFLRPVIGYGPESMFVVYNPFYPTKLGQVERRNASPDRSHNETWDSLIITGLLGFVTYIGIFLSAFYFGFVWLGLINQPKDIWLFWISLFVGGGLSTVILVLWGGLAYFGVGLPFGLALGLVVYLTILGIRFYQKKGERGNFKPGMDQQKDMIQTRNYFYAVFLSIILAHFLEINFGIAIGSTRLLFWIFTALLLVVRYNLTDLVSKDSDEVPFTSYRFDTAAQTINRTRLRSGKPRKRSLDNTNPNSRWIYSAGVQGSLISICVITLGFDFIVNPERLTKVSDLLSTSLLHLNGDKSQISFGILGIILLTWLCGCFLFIMEGGESENQVSFWKRFVVLSGTSVVLIFPYLLIHSNILTTIASFRIASIDTLLEQSFRVINLLNFYYWYLGIILLFLVYCLYHNNRKFTHSSSKTWSGWIAAGGSVVLGVFIINVLNIQPIQSDILFKLAEPFSVTSQWAIVGLLYDRAIELSPRQDYYYLFKGKADLELAMNAKSPEEQSSFALRAEQNLLHAQSINPLNVDHTANVARLYSWWASISDGERKIQFFNKSDHNYSRSVVLSPNNPSLWAEWSTIYLDIIFQPERSLELLDHALQLDDQYNVTQGYAGNFYYRLAQNDSEMQNRSEAVERAKHYYQTAADLSKGDTRVKYLIDLSNVFINQAELMDDEAQVIGYDYALVQSALEILLEAEMYVEGDNENVNLKAQIAKIYNELDNQEKALEYVDLALKIANENQKTYLAQLKELILSSP